MTRTVCAVASLRHCSTEAMIAALLVAKLSWERPRIRNTNTRGAWRDCAGTRRVGSSKGAMRYALLPCGWVRDENANSTAQNASRTKSHTLRDTRSRKKTTKRAGDRQYLAPVHECGGITGRCAGSCRLAVGSSRFPTLCMRRARVYATVVNPFGRTARFHGADLSRRSRRNTEVQM